MSFLLISNKFGIINYRFCNYFENDVAWQGKFVIEPLKSNVLEKERPSK